MSHAAKSIFIFGIYIILTGLLFLIIPHPILSLIDIQNPDNLVVRILGMLLIFYGYFYLRAGLKGKEMRAFYRWTTHTRCCAILFLIFFTVAGWAHPLVIAFGAVELAGAAWTHFALVHEEKQEKK